MTALKLTTIGTSTGAVIPKEMLARLKVKKGDILYAIETPGGYLLTPYDPAIDEQLNAGLQFMKDCRDTFNGCAGIVLTYDFQFPPVDAALCIDLVEAKLLCFEQGCPKISGRSGHRPRRRN